MINTGLNAEILNKLDYFFEITPDLFCIAGYDGYFKRINPAVSKLLGYDEEVLFNTPINEFVHPEDRELTAKAREELTKSKPLLNFENRYITKNGEVVWLSWTSMFIEKDRLGFDMESVKGKIFGLNQKFHNHEDSKGIGLYLIYNQIKKMHCNIEVESKVNVGTKFTITFQPL